MSERCHYQNADANGDAAVYAIGFAIIMWIALGVYRLFFFNPNSVHRRR